MLKKKGMIVKKIMTFIVCLVVALAIDFLREEAFSRGNSHFLKAGLLASGELQAAGPIESYPPPAPAGSPKSPYPTSETTPSAKGDPYPSPVYQPPIKKPDNLR